MKQPSKKAARAEIAAINVKLAAFESAWRERGVAEGDFEDRAALLSRRAYLTNIVWSAINPVDLLTR